jgi:iron(III) transport system substrate-binding protein
MTKKPLALILLLAALLAVAPGPARAQANLYGSPELIEAAKKEGKIVYYTANVLEVEHEIVKAFNKRFPFVKVEVIRAPGGQLITRFKSEAAAGKLLADAFNHSDRGLVKEIEDLFADYKPPNGDDYLPDSRVSDKLWPLITVGWALAYNPELVKNPPKSWMDMTKPEYTGMIGQVIAPSGGTTWTRAMFERQVLGEDYWAKQAATKPVLYPSNAPLSDSLIRGEVRLAPLLYNVGFPKERDGAPLKSVFPTEGVPATPFAAGVPKSAQNPNAARLFLNWCLSKEGQEFLVSELGHLTSLKNGPVPKGFDPKVSKLWLANFDEFDRLRASWLEDWNKVYNYRQ